MPPQTKSKKYKIQLFLEQTSFFHTNINNKKCKIVWKMQCLKNGSKMQCLKKAQKVQLTLFPLTYFHLVTVNGGWEWNYSHHTFFYTENCYLLTWNLSHILRNLKIFKKEKKNFWIWRNIFYWSYHILTFSAGNLTFTCFT